MNSQRQPPPNNQKPAYPQQARPAPPRQSPFPQPQMAERQRSRPDPQFPTQPVLNSQRDPRPDQPYNNHPRDPRLNQQQQQQQLPPTLQRRPDPPLQRQPSRPDQQQQPQLQRQPSRPDQQPQQQMAAPHDAYVYKELPINPAAAAPMQRVAPVLMRAPSGPAPPSAPPAPSLYGSDSQYSQYSQSTVFQRPYDSGMVIRGNADDELDKSDVFWRRFNASAEQAASPEAEKGGVSWLEKTQGKSSRHNRTLWIVGLVFALLAAGGIGIGIFLSFRNSSNATRPDTLGGAENVAGAQAATIAGGAGAAGLGTSTGTTLHVTPTNTVA